MAANKSDKPAKIGGYKPTQELSSGAMGNLWLCHDPSLDRMVVVKQMRETLEENSDAVKRFMREGNILAHLNHPAIIQPHALWKEKDGKLSLSMEFVNGITLRQLLDKCKQPPLWVVMTILYEVLGALGHAHRAGVVHRDLKPANIMIDVDGRIRLLDFGIAHTENPLNDSEDSLTISGAILGTVTYMSPEQTLGEDATPASDLFAVGVIACEMLLGENIFRGENFADTVKRVQKLRVSEKAFDKNAPAGLRKFVIKLLAKKPKNRPLTAFDAANELSEMMKDLPRDLTPYMGMWTSSLKTNEYSTNDSQFCNPPTYKASKKGTFVLGMLAGATIAMAVAYLLHFVL
ncbi:MAG: serine/threonine protein kinase [Fibrobacter sp.]|nr:serine/threonine protein kinase [Fibrobacter sp.]